MYFSGFVILAHIHYGSCVVAEMCDHLHVRPFHIKHSQGRHEGDTKVEDTVHLLSAQENPV